LLHIIRLDGIHQLPSRTQLLKPQVHVVRAADCVQKVREEELEEVFPPVEQHAPEYHSTHPRDHHHANEMRGERLDVVDLAHYPELGNHGQSLDVHGECDQDLLGQPLFPRVEEEGQDNGQETERGRLQILRRLDVSSVIVLLAKIDSHHAHASGPKELAVGKLGLDQSSFESPNAPNDVGHAEADLGVHGEAVNGLGLHDLGAEKAGGEVRDNVPDHEQEDVLHGVVVFGG